MAKDDVQELKEWLTQRLSGEDSNLMKAIKDTSKKLDEHITRSEKRNEELSCKIDLHYEEIKPLLEAQSDFKRFSQWLLRLGALAAAWLTIKGLWK